MSTSTNSNETLQSERIKFELDQYNRNASNDELIVDLQRVALELGKNSVTRAEQDERGRFNSATFFRRFGNWAAALEQAGLEETRTPMNIPEGELFKNLEEVWIKRGRQPRIRDLYKPLSKYSGTTYENRFGGWRNALEAFVKYINEEGPSSSELHTEKSKDGHEVMQRGTRHINRRLIVRVLMRDKSRCRLCGRSIDTDDSVDFHIDHIKPWSKGGLTVLENLQTLCSKCNLGKSDLDFDNSAINEVQNVQI